MKTEEKYRLIYEHFTEGILVIQDGYIVFLNPRILEASGYTWNELTQLPAINFVHRDNRKLASSICANDNFEEDEPRLYKLKVCVKDQTVKLMNFKVNKVTWEGCCAFLVFVKGAGEDD